MFMIDYIRRWIKIRKLENSLKTEVVEKNLYQKIEDFYENEFNYGELIKLYFRALEQKTLHITNEDRANTYYKIALAFLNLGQWDKAKLHFETSMNLLKDRKEEIVEVMDLKTSNFYNLFLLTHDETLAQQAIEIIKKIIVDYPDYERKRDQYLYLADIYLHLRMFDQAISACSEALKLSGDELKKGEAYQMFASIYHSQQNYSEAEKYYTKSLESAGDDKLVYSKIYYDLGKLYLEKGEKQHGHAAFRDALKFRKYSPWLRDTADYVKEIKEHLKKK